MNYSELLRVRTSLLWFTGIIAAGVLIDAISVGYKSILGGHVEVHVDMGSDIVPISVLLSLVGFVVVIMSTIFGASLNRYREYAETVMTFPVSRSRFAVSILATDVAALAIAFVIAIILGVGIVSTVNGLWPHFRFDEQIVPRLIISFGAVVLWFALSQAVSAWLPHRAGYIAGLTWPAFIVVASLEAAHKYLPGWLSAVVNLLSYANPLTYLSASVTPSGTVDCGLGSGFMVPALAVWLVSFVALAVAVAGWQRQEI